MKFQFHFAKYTPGNSISDGPITNIISVPCILIEVLSHAHAKGGEILNDFKFGTFIGRFPSDTLANMAVKGLWSVYRLQGFCMFVLISVSCRVLQRQFMLV